MSVNSSEIRITVASALPSNFTWAKGLSVGPEVSTASALPAEQSQKTYLVFTLSVNEHLFILLCSYDSGFLKSISFIM